VCKREFNVSEDHYGESVMVSNVAVNKDKYATVGYSSSNLFSDSDPYNKKYISVKDSNNKKKISLDLENNQFVEDAEKMLKNCSDNEFEFIYGKFEPCNVCLTRSDKTKYLIENYPKSICDNIKKYMQEYKRSSKNKQKDRETFRGINDQSIKDEYFDFDIINDERLNILSLINAKNNLIGRHSKIDFIIENIPKAEFEKQYEFINAIFNLDDETQKKLFKEFDITSPTLPIANKIRLLCSYHNYNEIKEVYDNLTSETDISHEDENSQNIKSSPSLSIDLNNLALEKFFEAEKILNEKMAYGRDFKNKVQNLINEVNSFESEYIEKSEKEDLIYGLETIIDDFHRRFKKLKNLKQELILFKNLVNDPSSEELSISEINEFFEKVQNVKINIYERRFNNKKNDFEEFLEREERLKKQFDKKVLDYKELYSSGVNHLNGIIVKCESIEVEIDSLLKNIDDLDTDFVSEDEIKLLKNKISDTLDESKTFKSEINDSLNDLYEFEHMIDNFNKIYMIDSSIELLQNFIDNVDLIKLDYFNKKLTDFKTNFNELYALEQDLNSIDERTLEKIDSVKEIFEDDFFSFEIMEFNFSNEDIINIKKDIIKDIKNKKFDGEIDSGFIIGYFKRYQNNYNLSEEELDYLIKNIDLSNYDEDTIDYSKKMTLEYSKDNKMEREEIILRFKNYLLVKNREKNYLIKLDSIFDVLDLENNDYFNEYSLTEDELNEVYDKSKQRILKGYKGSVNKLVNDEMTEFNEELKTKARESLEIFYKRSDFYEITHLKRLESGRFINKIEDFIEINEIRSDNISKENMIILSQCFIENKTIEVSDLTLIK